jgi:hypothetical protein
MEFTISDKKTADKALDYFNGFHDGFIKHLSINSMDYFESNDSQRMTGKFQVTIDFCHHNFQEYWKGKDKNKNKIIRAVFDNVSKFSLNTDNFQPQNWYIRVISIEQSQEGQLKLINDGKDVLHFGTARFNEI